MTSCSAAARSLPWTAVPSCLAINGTNTDAVVPSVEIWVGVTPSPSTPSTDAIEIRACSIAVRSASVSPPSRWNTTAPGMVSTFRNFALSFATIVDSAEPGR